MHEIPPRGARSVRGVRSEAGSAYVIALLVLVVLTVIGLALTLITQTEVQIGSTERSLNRSFYSADSGPNIALAGTLSKNWGDNIKLSLNTTAQDTGASSNPSTFFSDELTVTPLVQINQSPCPWSEMADSGGYQSGYQIVMNAVTSTDTRTGFVGSAKAPLVQKTVTSMIAIECWQPSVKKAQDNDSSNALQKVNPH
jgi:hypothetical protein